MSNRQKPGVYRTCRMGKVGQLGHVTYRETVIGLVEVLPETVTCSCGDDSVCCYQMFLNPLNAELNPICYLLVLLGAHPFFTLAG